MGDRNPTTNHMESKKGGRLDKVDKDGATNTCLMYDAAYSADYND